MTDKEIKRMLKNAYSVSESDSGRMFMKKHENRSRRIFDVIENEFRYMGLKSIFVGIILCALLMTVVWKGDENTMWVTSSMIPILAVLPITLLFRPERYGMYELETAARFSTKFIRLIRMFILGIFSSAVILCGSIFLNRQWSYGMPDIVIYMLFPYFASIWGCLFVSRKWNGKESTVGVPLICLVTGFLPSVARELRSAEITPDYVYLALTIVAVAAVIRECKEFINERSDLSWNLY